MVIWRWDLYLKSHPKDSRSPGSISGPLVYKAGSLTARPLRLLFLAFCICKNRFIVRGLILKWGQKLCNTYEILKEFHLLLPFCCQILLACCKKIIIIIDNSIRPTKTYHSIRPTKTYQMSHIMRNPAQLISACFHYIGRTFPLLLKSEISSSSHFLWLYSPLCIRSG